MPRRHGPPSARALRDKRLIEELRRIHAENYSVYGVRKMHHTMVRAGWQIGRDQVARLMRAAGLQGVRRGRKPITTRPASEPDIGPDLVECQFAADDLAVLGRLVGDWPVLIVEPWYGGTVHSLVSGALNPVPRRLESHRVPSREFRRYGTAAERRAAHGLDCVGIRDVVDSLIDSTS